MAAVRRRKTGNPSDSLASESEKEEMGRSGEVSLEEEACAAVLDETFKKATEDNGPMQEMVETMTVLGHEEREMLLEWSAGMMPQEISASNWECCKLSGWLSGG